MRLLNCALWHLREGRVQPAYECLASAASCGADAKTLAAVAATCTRSIGAEKLEAKDEAQLHAAVRDMCGRVVAEATRLTTTYSVELTKTPLGLGLSLADDFVTEVKPDSQAARDGRIKVGDRVVAVNGEAPTAAKPSSAILQATVAGTIVKLEFTSEPKAFSAVTEAGQSSSVSADPSVPASPSKVRTVPVAAPARDSQKMRRAAELLESWKLDPSELVHGDKVGSGGQADVYVGRWQVSSRASPHIPTGGPPFRPFL